MFKDDETRLRHILDAAREAVGFVEGLHREDLDKDRKLNLSLIRLLEVIGEAARNLSSEFRQEHPDLVVEEYGRDARPSHSWIFRCQS